MTDMTSQAKISFDHLLKTITARLIAADSAQLDAALDDCLSWLGEYFAVDSIVFGGLTISGEHTPSLYVWPKENPIVMSSVSPTPGPGMAARCRRDGALVYNRLEDLDDLPQFMEHSRQVGIMAAVFWLHRERGTYLEGMAMNSRTPRRWPEDTVERLGTIGEVLYNALFRRRAELEVERLRQFERVASNIVSKFVHLPSEKLDEAINMALKRVCETVDVDLGIFLQWNSSEKSTMTVSHEWIAEGIGGPYFHGAVLAADYPWLASRLREATPMHISSLDDFPPEAIIVRTMCERIGVQSSTWAPFMAAHGLQGYIALGSIDRSGMWQESIVSQLGLIGNVFASSIERQRTDLELKQAYEKIKILKDHLEVENTVLREEIKTSFKDDEIVGKSQEFQTTLHQVEQVSHTNSVVLLLGETGTGKSFVARSIHQQSGRKDSPLVTVNCAALPAALIESELFGHEKGAFTGAVERKIGRFELADDGTIFLDEIGDLPLELQAKLLRVLQDHEFERLGSSNTITVNTRVIAATNRDLDLLIEQGTFRTDLYYRLSVFPIRMPPLRERRSDIPLLVWFFLTNLRSRIGKTIETVPESVMDALVSYDWPGNVRELRNVIERGMIVSYDHRLELGNILPVRRKRKDATTQTVEHSGANLQEVERIHIISVLEECGWRVSGKNGAAEHLGLKRSTLQSRMKKLGIRRPEI